MKIDDGIPIPEPKLRMRDVGYERLEVGQSIFITIATQEQVAASIRSFKRSKNKRYAERKYTTRKTTEKDSSGKNVHGVRVWRIE